MRILLGFILALSVSFACDQPYEEVGGYKIGCELDIMTMPYDNKSDDFNIKIFSNKLQDSFFSMVYVSMMDGKLEELRFDRVYEDADEMDRDIDILLSSLKDRWGELYQVKDGISSAYVSTDVQSDIVDSITVIKIFNGSNGIIAVSYKSKRMADYEKEKKMAKNKQKIKSLEGF